jgi:hypothetical protein
MLMVNKVAVCKRLYVFNCYLMIGKKSHIKRQVLHFLCGQICACYLQPALKWHVSVENTKISISL